MKLRMIMGIGAVGAIGLAGCDAEKTVAEPQGLKIAVAPLNLAGIGYACYDILVENQGAAYKTVGGGNDVVSLGDPLVAGDAGAICSNDYGNGSGGAITYVAPCDASPGADTVPGGTVQNKVTLWVDGLYNTNGTPIGAGTWENPCVGGCSLDFDCKANADTLVEFNFTIMRDAQQGFFDVAVNFEDVFCSAKVDCQYAPTAGQEVGQYIRLVHGTDGERTLTAVAAVACTGGDFEAGDENDDRTHLYATDFVVECDGVATSLEVDGEGNYYPPYDATDDSTFRPVGIEQVMVFRGLEALLNGPSGPSADKMYWNVAVGFTEGTPVNGVPTIADNCKLRWAVTASKGPIEAAFAKSNVTYPYIQSSVDISDADGLLICTRHPVNEEVNGLSTGVSTKYTALGASLPTVPDAFVWHMSRTDTGAVVNGWTAPTSGDDL
jgi:hypothetical protein